LKIKAEDRDQIVFSKNGMYMGILKYYDESRVSSSGEIGKIEVLQLVRTEGERKSLTAKEMFKQSKNLKSKMSSVIDIRQEIEFPIKDPRFKDLKDYHVGNFFEIDGEGNFYLVINSDKPQCYYNGNNITNSFVQNG
jgi:hypothetical protein